MNEASFFSKNGERSFFIHPATSRYALERWNEHVMIYLSLYHSSAKSISRTWNDV